MVIGLRGRTEEGIEESKRALELDPLSTEVNSSGGPKLLLCASVWQGDRATSQDPRNGPELLARSHVLGVELRGQGDLPRAIAECERARETETTIPWPLAELAHAYAASGRKHEAEEILKQLKDRSKQSYVPGYNFAEIYIGLGDKEQALAFLEKAYADRSMLLTFLKVDPQFDSLRSDPRFKDLLRRVGLPQ